ncbi:MAG: penicillin acylase family protein [Holophagales bacterium]|nr:penicillin acylase family protein [Holophagales bacterium]
MRRLAIRALSGVVAVVLLLGLVLFVLVRRNLPADEGGPLPGLAAEVTVHIDDRGVATIHAASVEDALQAQGWLTARDRAFQLEILRRNASGRLAELFGSSALPLDRRHRLYGFARVAEAAVPLLPPRERADLEALASGINAYFTAHRGRLGLEFALLRREPEPWRPADSVAVLLLMYEQLTDDVEAQRGAEKLADLPSPPRVPSAPRHGRRRPPRARYPPLAPPGLPVVEDSAAKALPKAARFETTEEEGVAGSNAFAVSGSLSASGRPILAGDPHLGLEMPAIWLPMRFVVAGRTSEG